MPSTTSVRAYLHLLSSHGHTADQCFVRRSNGSIDTQDARRMQKEDINQVIDAGSADCKNIIFLDEDLENPEEVVAAFKRTSNGEALTKQQKMQNDIDTYSNGGRNAEQQIRRNPDFPVQSKKQKQ